MRIVVAGGTGLLGSALVPQLQQEGHSVGVLTRQPKASHHIQWDPYGSLTSWAHALDNVDAVVNLTGAPINRRWTAAHRRTLWNSRVHSTRTLVAAMKSVRRIPATLINASAVGIYGPHGDEVVTEETPPGSGFLPALAAAWEKEALGAGPQARVVLLRSGIVLDGERGALPQIALPFRFFVGGPVGTGRQYISWIHRDDWTAIVRWALTTETVSGPLNLTAPNPVTNLEFSQTLGRVLRRPTVVRVPEFAMRLALGEMASVILTGQRVFPEKAHERGFDFRYGDPEPALRAIYA